MERTKKCYGRTEGQTGWQTKGIPITPFRFRGGGGIKNPHPMVLTKLNQGGGGGGGGA